MSNGAVSLGGDSGGDEDTEGPDIPDKFSGRASNKGLTKGMSGPRLSPSDPSKSSLPQPVCIIVTGEKDVGKTVGPAGLPRPNDGTTYIVTFDDATMAGLRNFYEPEEMENIEVFEMTKRVYDDDGNVVYPGYDPNDPSTAETVIEETMYWLEQIEEAGDCDNLILDHFQELRDNISQSYTISHHNLDPLATLKPQHYNLRTRAVKMIEAKARNIPRHAMVLTGYGGEEKMQSRKTASGKTEWYVDFERPRWAERYKRPYHVHLHHSSTAKRGQNDPYEEATDDVEYFYRVVGSKHELFPLGKKINATDTNYSIFWEEEERAERVIDEMDVEA